MKRGQISLFIIVGLIILIFTTLAYFAITSLAPEQVETTDFSSFNFMYDSCLDTASRQAIQGLEVYGGYLDTPPSYYLYDDIEVPYYYSDGDIKTISKTDLENNLADTFILLLNDCLDLDYWKNIYEIEKMNPIISTNIYDNKITFNVDYPIQLDAGIRSISIPKQTFTVDSKLGKLHSIASQIADKAEQDPNWIDVYFLMNLDIKVTEIFIENAFYIYMLEDRFGRNEDYLLFGIDYGDTNA